MVHGSGTIAACGGLLVPFARSGTTGVDFCGCAVLLRFKGRKWLGRPHAIRVDSGLLCSRHIPFHPAVQNFAKVYQHTVGFGRVKRAPLVVVLPVFVPSSWPGSTIAHTLLWSVLPCRARSARSALLSQARLCPARQLSFVGLARREHSRPPDFFSSMLFRAPDLGGFLVLPISLLLNSVGVRRRGCAVRFFALSERELEFAHSVLAVLVMGCVGKETFKFVRGGDLASFPLELAKCQLSSV